MTDIKNMKQIADDSGYFVSDYIKREDAMAEFTTNGSATVYGIDKCKAIISRLQLVPSADVVEVVRCKDCEYWDDHERCDFWSSIMSPYYPEKNDYCSYGERAEA